MGHYQSGKCPTHLTVILIFHCMSDINNLNHPLLPQMTDRPHYSKAFWESNAVWYCSEALFKTDLGGIWSLPLAVSSLALKFQVAAPQSIHCHFFTPPGNKF